MIKENGKTCVCLKTTLHIDSEQRVFLKGLKHLVDVLLYCTGNAEQNCGHKHYCFTLEV